MLFHSSALPLPGAVTRRLDSVALGLLSADGPVVDFSQPPGEPALVAADSVSWRIFKNHATLFIGGVAAVILELAEPHVRDGVWQHSSFRTDALKRLQRTGMAAMVTVYAARIQAQAMIAGVVRRHARVTGTTVEGEPYAANDPILLDWVQATASFGFMEAYHRHARALTTAERDLLLAEARPAAALYGALGAPGTQGEMRELFDAMMGRLAPSPVIFEFLQIMNDVEALTGAARPLQRLFVRAAVDLVPARIRQRLGLGPDWSLSTLERASVDLAARTADRLLLPSLPHVQACRRLGLPDDYLYRRHA